MAGERRWWPRAGCDAAVSMIGPADAALPAVRAFDISEGGARIGLTEPVEPGASCRVTFTPLHGPILSEAPVTVVWCRPEPEEGPVTHVAGVAFGDLAPDQCRALAVLVRQQTAAMIRRMREATLGLQRVSRFLDRVTDLEALLESIMGEARRLTAAEASSLLLWDATRQELFFEVALGEKGDGVKPIRLKRGQGVAGAVAESRLPLHVPDVTRDERWFQQADETSGFHTRSILAVPMLREGRLVGVLEVLNAPAETGFTDDDEANLSVLAGQAALVIENARLHREKVEAQRLAAIGQTVAGLAHCIKNILNGIQGGAYILDSGFERDDPKKLHAGWAMVKRNNSFLSDLVLDMLSYAKEREPVREETDVNQLVKTVADLLAERARPAGIAVTADLDKSLVSAPIDRTAIYRVVLNLGGNALDACAKGTGRVVFTSRLVDDAWFALDVADNGSGIAPEHRDKLFTEFFSTKGAKGTGLGLPVCAKIVREHGGTIDVTSEVGAGTQFTVRLPRQHEGDRQREESGA